MEIFVMGFALLLAKDQSSNNGLIIGGVIALLALVAAGTLKNRMGWILGWIVQIGMLAYGFIIFTMFFMGAIFLALWIAAIVVGRKGEAARAALIKARDGEKSAGPKGQ